MRKHFAVEVGDWISWIRRGWWWLVKVEECWGGKMFFCCEENGRNSYWGSSALSVSHSASLSSSTVLPSVGGSSGADHK